MKKTPSSILFVRSGGGLPGLDIHAGIWQALSEAGIHSTHNAGCSAGAIMAALDSAGRSAEEVCGLLRGLSDADVRRERFAWKLRLPWVDYFLDSAPIRDLLAKWLPARWSDLRKPLEVVATHVETGECIRFGDSEGLQLNDALVSLVLASMSISGVFPWVTIGGAHFADGGVRANLPLPKCHADFDEIWLLIATRPIRYRRRARGILSRLLLNLDWYAYDQIADVLEATGGRSKFRVIWPALYPDGGALRFDHRLIQDAYEQTRKILAEGNAK